MLLNNKSNAVAAGGVTAALSLVFLFIASVFPFCRLAFVFAASVITGLLIAMYGYKTALFHYAAVAVIALFIIPNKTMVLLYAVIAGNYPAVKFKIDKVRSKPLNFIIKLIIFNCYMAVSYIILTKLLGVDLITEYSFAVLWLGMLAVFYVYDFVYTPFVMKLYNLINK